MLKRVSRMTPCWKEWPIYMTVLQRVYQELEEISISDERHFDN